MEGQTKLVVIDGTNIFWRAYHGLIKQKFEKDGISTWGVYGSLNTVAATCRYHHPSHLVVVFDWGKSEYRLNIWSKYKAGRPQSELVDYDEAINQQDVFRKLLPQFGVVAWREEGVEADDVIASLVGRFKFDVDEVIIVSGDKDMKQLVDSNVTLYQPSLGLKMEKWWTEDDIVAEYGMPPWMLPEVWALSGDKVDNVPGVPGIGEKTAVKLIQKYGDLSKVALSDEKKVQGYRHDMKMSHELVRLYPELSNFPMSLDDITFTPVAPSDKSSKELVASLHELGFDSLVSRFSQGTLWRQRGTRLRDLKAK